MWKNTCKKDDKRIMLCYIRSSNIEKIYATYIAKVTKQDLKRTINQYRNKNSLIKSGHRVSTDNLQKAESQ